MPSFCAVFGCAKRGDRDRVRFFRIPAAFKDRGEKLNALSKERRRCWVKSLKRGVLPESYLKYARICSDHFISGAPSHLEDKDNPDWIPTQNMGFTSLIVKTDQAVQRYSRSTQRTKRVRQEESWESTPDPSTSAEDCSGESTKISVAVQTDLKLEELTQILSDINFCSSKLQYLEKKLKCTELSEESFITNDHKTLYLTGFPKSDMMFLIFKDIAPYLSNRFALSPFSQCLLTLMKLRLNLPFEYLSYRFAVSPQTISCIFYKCIDILYVRYKNFVFWPDRELLQKNMPAFFRDKFDDKVAVIIDCFEIFTEKPFSFINSASSWSNYKHHQTIKFLIGISPEGTISYISEAWSGRTSDKYLIENCGFLNMILPGDIILADRGFSVQDSVETLGGHLGIPAFTKGKNQLHLSNLESTCNIANVQIHVERVIGLLRKKFKICQGPVPLSMLSISRDNMSSFDKILRVCSAFINLCPSQIPSD